MPEKVCSLKWNDGFKAKVCTLAPFTNFGRNP